jgi:hypothetical protein
VKRRELIEALEFLQIARPARWAWRQLAPQRLRLERYCRIWGLLPWLPVVPEEEFRASLKAAIAALREADPACTFGDYLEFGVSRGTTLAYVYHTLREEGLDHVRLIGFDSFEGLPPEAQAEGDKPQGRWSPGDFYTTLPAAKRYLQKQRVDMSRVELVKGWFRDTLTPETRAHLGIAKASIILIDCDIYSASKAALAFCQSLIADRAILIFDDWGCMADHGLRGEKESFEEFLADNPELRSRPIVGYTPESRVFLVSKSRAS